MKFLAVVANWVINNHKPLTTMKTNEATNRGAATEQGESKQELNQKTSKQFIISTTIGVLTILGVAASYYFGLIGS